VTSVGTAVVDDDLWFPVVVEVVVFGEDLFDLFVDATVVVFSQSNDELVGWLSTESTAEESVEFQQVYAGTFSQSLFETSTLVSTFTVKTSSED